MVEPFILCPKITCENDWRTHGWCEMVGSEVWSSSLIEPISSVRIQSWWLRCTRPVRPSKLVAADLNFACARRRTLRKELNFWDIFRDRNLRRCPTCINTIHCLPLLRSEFLNLQICRKLMSVPRFGCNGIMYREILVCAELYRFWISLWPLKLASISPESLFFRRHLPKTLNLERCENA